MYAPVTSTMRPSILSRRIRSSGSLSNRETAELEYEREQKMLQLKQQKYSDVECYLKASRGGPEVRADPVASAARQHFVEDARHAQDVQVSTKRDRKDFLRQQEKDTVKHIVALDDQKSVQEKRMKQEKYERERATMLENMKLARERQEEQKRRIEAEKARERQNVQLLQSRPVLYR